MTLAGRYDLLKPPIGEGSFGAVYLAQDRKMPRQVAVKVLHASYAADPKASARFLRELVAACRVSHENVIQVLDVGDDADHGLFYVMEFAEGVSLEERLGGLPMAWPALRVIAGQLAAALDAIHSAGIVHRDLKPRNIMLVERSSQDDLVKVLDFGIAVIHEGEFGDDIELTGTRMVVGTPPYMSPEQTYMKADRERLGLEVDGRCDLYALGVILYEMLVGHRPFQGDAHELALAHRHETPPHPWGHASSDVPHGFCDLVMRLLAKTPGERPASAEQVLATLRSLETGAAAQVRPYGKEQDVQDAPTCIVDAVGSRAQEISTLTTPAVSLSTLATEAEEDVDFSSVGVSKVPIALAVFALCAVLTWALWPGLQSGSALSSATDTQNTGASPAVINDSDDARATALRPDVSVAEAAPAKQEVSLMVTSIPADAEVLLDGRIVGRTPLTTTLPTGTESQHLLEIQRAGYGVRQVPIAVAPSLTGKALVFNEILVPDAAKRRPARKRRKGGKKAKTTDHFEDL